MICPKCKSSDDKVTDSREFDSPASVRRRRHCNACGHRWSTVELEAERDAAIGRGQGKLVPTQVTASSIRELLDDVDAQISALATVNSKIRRRLAGMGD